MKLDGCSLLNPVSSKNIFTILLLGTKFSGKGCKEYSTGLSSQLCRNMYKTSCCS